MGQQFGLAFDEIGTSQRRNTEVRLTHRWRELDSNLPFRALNEHRTAPGQDFCYPFDLQSV
jgi:hypothetical protein